MVNAALQPLPKGQPVDVERINRFMGAASGFEDHGIQWTLTEWGDATAAALIVRNPGGGPGIDVDRITVEDLTVTDDLLVGDDAQISGDLLVLGNYDLRGNGTLGNAATSDTLVVNAVETHNGAATFNNALVSESAFLSNGSTALGNASSDTLVVNATGSFLATQTFGSTLMKVDPGNSRVIVGSGTALGTDTTPALHVVGRLYVAPESANDLAVEIRRSSASATPAFRLGLTSSNEFVIKDETDTVIALFDGATYMLDVKGDFRATDDIVAGARLVVAGTSWSGSEELRVVGQTRLEGLTTITADGLNVTGGIVLASSGNIDGNGGTAGQLRIGAVIVNGASLSGTEELRVVGQSRLEGAVTVTTGDVTLSTGNIIVTAGSITLASTPMVSINSSTNLVFGDATGISGTTAFLAGTAASHVYVGGAIPWSALASGSVGNLSAFSSTGSFGSGVGVIFIANRNTAPTSNPSGGGILYSASGAGTWRGSGGTITTFGPAEPHCQTCTRDFAWQWENEKYGKLTICAWCLTENMHKGIMARDPGPLGAKP